MSETNLPLHFVVEDGGTLPAYATPGSSGMDLRSTEDVCLQPFERKLVHTGLSVRVPAGYEAQIRPRSGLALKSGISLVNSPGTIDSDYRGEIGIIVINLSSDVVQLNKGERIAQMVICPVVRADIMKVESLDETERGEGGFGSTGTS